MIKILHTGDSHLGAKLGWLGNKAYDQRRQLLTTFINCVDSAIKMKVDLFLIAGDLFDNPYPNQSTISIIESKINDLGKNGIYSAIIPGNHDRLEEESVYFNILNGNEFCKIYRNKQAEIFEIGHLGLSIYGQGTFEQFSSDSPLIPLIKKKQQSKKQKLNIALVHGSVCIHSQISKNFPIQPEEIENSGFNYIALGDWHGYTDVSHKGTKALYSGSPEVIARDQEKSGKAIYIELDEKEVKIQPIETGRRKIINKEFNLDQIIHSSKCSAKELEADLIESISKEAGKDNITFIDIIGKKKLSWQIKMEDMEYLLKDKFFYLKIFDKSNLEIKDEDLKVYPEEMALGRFIRLIQKDIKNEQDPVKKELLKDVLQEGINRLT